MRFSVLFMLLFISFTVHSQDNTPLKLDLRKSIELALKNNHDLKQARLDHAKAEEQVSEAYGSSLLPDISGNIEYSRAIKRPVFVLDFNGMTQTIESGSDNTLTASVNATQSLLSAEMFYAVPIAETFENASKRMEEYTEGQTIVTAKQAYLNLLVSMELVKLSKLQLKRAEENYNNTKSKYDAGLVSEYDYLKAKVQKQNLIPAVTESENNVHVTKNNLKVILGIEIDREIIVTDSLEYRKMDIPEMSIGLSKVMQENDLIEQQELQRKLQDYNVTYNSLQKLPKLNAFGNWMASAQENDGRDFGRWRYRNSIAVGLTLQVPMLNVFTTLDSKVDQAEIDLKKAEEALAKTKKDIQTDYENTILLIRKTEQQIEAYDSAVKESERGYEIAVKRYDAGLATQLEVTSALVDFSNAKVNYLRSLTEYYYYHARLDHLLGKNINELSY